MTPSGEKNTISKDWITDSKNYYIPNESAISEIIRNVREGDYCTVLGPPYCQKTFLLEDVRTRLEKTGDEVCVLLELQKVDFAADEEFLPAFAAMLWPLLKEQIDVKTPQSLEKVSDEQSLKFFLQNCVKNLKRDLVLLIDHLERVRTGPLKSLLLVLRTIYNERDLNTRCWLGVVTASSLSIASLSLEPTSPFNIARVTVVQDLDERISEKLIDQILGKNGINITPAARLRCIQATEGDRYLIASLCNRCADVVLEKQKKHVTKGEVEEAIKWFLNTEAAHHAPLLETIRTLEEDPTALVNVLKILNRGQVPRRDLEIPLKTDTEIDELQLTGAVRVKDIENQKVYFIRNEIYKNYLEKHFNPDRIALSFGISGRWDSAIPYLEQLMVDNPKYRSPLLGMVANSIYAAQGINEACERLARSLCQAFGILKVRIYLVNPERSHLIQFSQVGFGEPHPKEFSLRELQPEVKAYFSEDYSAVYSDSGEEIVLIPLKRGDGEPLGLAAIYGFSADPLNDDFLRLLAFLKQVTRAIESIIDRERKLLQLATLHETGKQVTSSLDLKQVLQAVVKAAIAAVPAAQKGSLFRWDEKMQKLIIHAHEGFRDDISNLMKLDRGEGLAGWVYEERVPLMIGDVHSDSRAKIGPHHKVKEQRSAILVPLEAWGRVIGVLCLDNVTTYNVFRESDLDLLSTFGAQAAIAIKNANLYTELHELGILINQGDLNPREIFEMVVRSITHVSGAMGANMFLMRDTDDPESSVSQKPILSASYGLGDDFEKKIKPRPNGLTYLVLKERKPYGVSNPTKPPGINRTGLRRGVKASLCLPLMIQDSIIGVLFVHHNKLHAFSGNEIEMLSLFANQAALAIENARQREELTMTKAVAWMGIVFTSLAHRITQKSAAIRNTVGGIRRLLQKKPEITERLDRIEKYARTVAEIPGRALLPYQDHVESLDLNILLRQEITEWCRSENDLVYNFIGLTNDNTTIHADPEWLKVVLEILTMNAIRATESSPHRKLSVKSQIRGQRVVTEITNTGKMIPKKLQKLLFKKPIPREQGAEGSGVGLLIARTIIHRYGGDIELLRTSQEETTFSFWLPLHKPKHK